MQTPLIYRHILQGCQSTPLSSYLKSLGIFRILGEQIAPEIRGYWKDECFVIATALNRKEIEHFFLREYQPTPMLTPWNSSAGFDENDRAKDDYSLQIIKESTSTRFAPFRKAIDDCYASIERVRNIKKSAEKKKALLQDAKRRWRGGHLLWLESAVAINEKGDPQYASLVGTGGNDGRLEFAFHYLKHLGECFAISSPDSPPSDLAEFWLRWALWQETSPSNISKFHRREVKGKPSYGQFTPAFAGKYNASNLPKVRSSLNPFDFVLMMEGTLMFRSSLTNLLEAKSDTNRLSSPFIIQSREAGFISAAPGEKNRNEQWMPLWRQPISIRECVALFKEGRARNEKRKATDTVDMALAVSRLGTTHGISSFQRFGYFERNGRAYSAVPLGEFQVARAKPKRLDCLMDVKPWLKWLNRNYHSFQTGPSSLTLATQRINDCLLEVTKEPSNCQKWQDLLVKMASIEELLTFQNAPNLRPIPRLGTKWMFVADDGSTEYRLARSLAFQNRDDNVRRHWIHIDKVTGLIGVEGRQTADVVMSGISGLNDLSALIGRRIIETRKAADRHLNLCGEYPLFYVSINDLAILHRGELDLNYVLKLARALACIPLRDRRKIFPKKQQEENCSRSLDSLDEGWIAIRLAMLPGPLTINGIELDVPLDATIFRQLQAGNSESAVRFALRRLRSDGHHSIIRKIHMESGQERIWSAALAFPINEETQQILFKHLILMKD